MKRITDIFIPTLIILSNLVFIPLTIQIITTTGGPMGFGLLILPVTISINLLLLPAILTIVKRNESNTGFKIINLLGLTWSLFWLIIYFYSLTR
jgi:hypothetical protein